MAQSEAAAYPEHIIAAAVGQLPPEQAHALVAGELDRIAAIEDLRRRDEALAMLAPSLTPADLPRAVELARSTAPDHAYAALAKLAGRLGDPDREAAVDGQRAHALVLAASVAGADRPQVLEDALAAANSVVEDDERATLLCDLLTVLPLERALEAFGEMLEASLGRRRSGSYGGNPFYAGLGRPFLLSMLERATPWLGTLDEPLLVSHVAQSVRDVVRWWP